jgi:hypothetical protein
MIVPAKNKLLMIWFEQQAEITYLHGWSRAGPGNLEIAPVEGNTSKTT